MKLIYCLMILLWPFVSMGQMVRPLSIGDSVSDITITNVYNYPASTIRLTDLKGKLVILDFWSTWCSACIQSFPKMEGLQKEFGGKLQIILVNTYKGDSLQRVTSLFEKRKVITGESMDLPYSLLQSSLLEYFPYKFVPHYVWINKEGKVIAITSASEISPKNIQQVIDGKNVSFHTKKDDLTFNVNKPLFVNHNGGSGDDFLFRSVITPYKEGLGYTVGHSGRAGKTSRFYALNQPLAAFLAIAFPHEMALPANRRFYSGDNAASLKATIASDNRNNLYCYEIITPAVTHAVLMNYVRQDIVRFFGIVAHRETRNIKCYELHAPDQNKINYSRYSLPRSEFTDRSGHKFMRDIPVSYVVRILNNFLPSPLVDQTAIQHPVDIDLPDDLTNEKAVIQALKSAGFTITTSEKAMEVTVISNQTFSPKNESK
jgi:thiol-disulfide isomerase/thioredoxin